MESYWVASAEGTSLRPLGGAELRTNVAVVGAGIVGLTAALLLARAGRSVVVLEARRLGRQVTGGSTAKVTTQHGLIYAELAEKHGRDAAALYAESNRAALEWIAALVAERSIDCDFERRAAFVYTAEGPRVADLKREAEAATAAGLTASVVDSPPLPFPAAAALECPAQAQFHPVKYLDALAAELLERGARIFEGTRVVDVDHGRPCTVATQQGRVLADDVIVATHMPILDRGGFFGRAFPCRHMCIAGRWPEERQLDGMFLSADRPARSFRTAPAADGERRLIAIGEAFPTAQADEAKALAELEEFAERTLGVTEVTHRWGNQDYYSADRVPFVGALLPGSARIRVATGFNAWGITTGTAAAMILADDILGRSQPWAALYDSTRLGLKGGARTLLAKNVDVAKSWIAERVRPEAEADADAIAPGHGAIARVAGTVAAAYRDDAGVLHAFDARCTHLGCQVRFNAAERSWDCHCHGSRFGVDGEVLNGPAVHALRPVRAD